MDDGFVSFISCNSASLASFSVLPHLFFLIPRTVLPSWCLNVVVGKGDSEIYRGFHAIREKGMSVRDNPKSVLVVEIMSIEYMYYNFNWFC